MKTCKDCRFFRPVYHQFGKCDRQLSANSKIFTDDNKAGILVHITFSCSQFEPLRDVDSETV